MAQRFPRLPTPRPKDEDGNLTPRKKGPGIVEYNTKGYLDKIEQVKPGMTFETQSGSQFRMLASGTLIRVDRNRVKLNKKQRRINRQIVKERTKEMKAKVAEYENTTCICSHKRVQHKEDVGACLGCTCAKFVEDTYIPPE